MVRYVSLSDLFPGKHRCTLYRWRKAGKLGKPDLVINGREYYREDRFAPPDDAEPEAAPKADAAQQANPP
jgi:hypothetical protein